MRLDQLVRSLRQGSVPVLNDLDPEAAAVEVGGVAHDSRRVTGGDVFACVVGTRFDGHDFAATAVAHGAGALLVERHVDAPVPLIEVENVRRAMGPAAAAVHGYPSGSLSVIGITGTNGKTTVAHMVRSGLEHSARRSAVIGTLSGSRTTPEGPELQAQLRQWADGGVEFVVMEVSSHALELHRVDGTRFAVAAFTNLGRDHLDFHGTPEAYFRAKARLFEPTLSDRAVINIDDPHGRLLADTVEIPALRVALSQTSDRRTESGVVLVWEGTEIRVPMAGAHNSANALVAAGILVSLGLSVEAAAEGIATTPPVPGRFERVDGPDDAITVVVDYAHTPDALEAVLAAGRDLIPGRLILVFGCGGDRDREKRPMMGRVAGESADLVVITSDNPRSEVPAAIIEDVRQGVNPGSEILTIEDRSEAIHHAVEAARPGDLVLIAGKGHETTQVIGDEVTELDDRLVARQALDRRGANDGDPDR